MYQIIVNNVRIPTIFWSLRDAINACHEEEARGVAVMTEIVML